MEIKALSTQEPGVLVRTLTGAILGSGGWVLSRGTNEEGQLMLLFEFERRHCVEIYSILVSAGLELSAQAHRLFTDLCQCTKHRDETCATEIASVDLEIQTLPADSVESQHPHSNF
jgi:hypothetical protein